MNNSDFNDFNQWQSGDNDDNNPNNSPFSRGFFYYGPVNPNFKKMWEEMYNNKDYMESLKDYLNIDDVLGNHMKPPMDKQKRSPKSKYSPTKVVHFTQDEYMKLIEIRGYLAITEQFAHVKALDKVINQIKINTIPFNKDSK